MGQEGVGLDVISRRVPFKQLRFSVATKALPAGVGGPLSDSGGDIVGPLAGAKLDDAHVGESVAAERILRDDGFDLLARGGHRHDDSTGAGDLPPGDQEIPRRVVLLEEGDVGTVRHSRPAARSALASERRACLSTGRARQRLHHGDVWQQRLGHGVPLFRYAGLL